MKNKVNVSVAMATYNGEKYIEEQLKSILNNLSLNDEIIISDDGSTDQTLEIINSFHDKRIHIIEGPKKGVIKNFENAILNCQGDYIFLSDQDDIWYDDKVKTILDIFRNDANTILIVHDNKMVDSNLNIINDSFFKFRKIKNGFVNNIIKNSFIGCCMAFKKELKSEIIPIPNNMPMHDQWIGLVALLNGNVRFINDKLVLYRRHDENVSSFKKNTLFRMVINRVNIILDIIKYKKGNKNYE